MPSGNARILHCYIETNALSFSELCKEAGYPTDLGGYYIRQLVDAKCLIKTTRGRYEITPHGKQQLISLERQTGPSTAVYARLCVMAIVRHGEKFVVIRRKRQPFVGFVEWPAMMLAPGEDIAGGAQRLLDSRLAVAGHPALLGFFRRIDLYENAIFDDKLFAVYSCDLGQDSLISDSSAYGDNLLLSADELQVIDRPAQALRDVYAFSQASVSYREQRYILSFEDIISY